MTQRSTRLIGLGVLLGALVGANALADPVSDAKPGKAAAQSDAKPDAKPNNMPGQRVEKADAKSEQAGSVPANRGAEGRSGKNGEMPTSADSKAMAGADSADSNRGMGMGRGAFRSEIRAIRDGMKDGSIKKEDVKGRLEKLRETQPERQKQHQQLIQQRWGTMLATPQAKQELTEHARRSALLDRALLLAQTEAKLPDRAKVIERIEKLSEREGSRHERVMTQLKAMPSSAQAKAPAQNPNPSDKPVQGGDR